MITKKALINSTAALVVVLLSGGYAFARTAYRTTAYNGYADYNQYSEDVARAQEGFQNDMDQAQDAFANAMRSAQQEFEQNMRDGKSMAEARSTFDQRFWEAQGQLNSQLIAAHNGMNDTMGSSNYTNGQNYSAQSTSYPTYYSRLHSDYTAQNTPAYGDFAVVPHDDYLDYTFTGDMLYDADDAYLSYYDDNGQSQVIAPCPLSLQDSQTARGRIYPSDLKGMKVGKTVGEVVKAFDAGKVYVNVHNNRYPNGYMYGKVAQQ